MSLNIPPVNGRFQDSKTENFMSNFQAAYIQRVTSKYPNIAQIDGEGDLSEEQRGRVKSTMNEIFQKMAEKAKATGVSPTNAFDCPELLNIVLDGFMEITTAIVTEVQQLPPKQPIAEVNEAEQLLIAECFVSEAVFSHATDQKPIVATDSLGPCIGVAGYDSENQCGFVIHFAIEADLKASKEMLTQKIMQMSTNTPIEIHLRGGIANCSEPLVAAIEEWVQEMSEKGCPMTIVSKDVLQKEFVKPMSISLDTRNGAVSNYHSCAKKIQITNQKELDTLYRKTALEVLAQKPEIKVVYEAFKSGL